MGEEDTTNWRLKQIETKTDKLETNDEKISTKVTIMESDVKTILSTHAIIKNTFIVFVVSNILMYVFTMWSKGQ